jgi:hypothetical protein
MSVITFAKFRLYLGLNNEMVHFIPSSIFREGQLLVVCAVTAVSEVLSSDEDEIDETNQEYLEKLQRKITKGSADSPFNVTSYIQV